MLFRTLLFLALAVASQAACPAGWTDDGEDSCSKSVTITMTDLGAARMEQVRAYHNYLYRYSGDVLALADWVAALIAGLPATQLQEDGQPSPPTVYGFGGKLWNQFVEELHELHPAWLNSPGADKQANALAATIPAAPAAP